MHLLFRQYTHRTSMQVSMSLCHLLQGRTPYERYLTQRIGSDRELLAALLLELYETSPCTNNQIFIGWINEAKLILCVFNDIPFSA